MGYAAAGPCFQLPALSHRKKTLRSSANCERTDGQCRSITERKFCSLTHWKPAGVYSPVVKSVEKKRSLLRRRDAIRVKTRNAVSEKPKPGGRSSASVPTRRSTFSTVLSTSFSSRCHSTLSVSSSNVFGARKPKCLRKAQ